MKPVKMGYFFLCTAAALVGCAGDLREENMQPGPGPGPGPTTSRVTVSQDSPGVQRAVVNATAADQWVYIRLDTLQEVQPATPETSQDWDIAIRRFLIKVNGGVSGSCGAEVAMMMSDFAAVAQAPASGYLTDQPDGADEGPDPDYAIIQHGDWYDYNIMTHILTPKQVVYVLKTCKSGYQKLQMAGYYDMAGTAGFPAFRVASVTAP